VIVVLSPRLNNLFGESSQIVNYATRVAPIRAFVIPEPLMATAMTAFRMTCSRLTAKTTTQEAWTIQDFDFAVHSKSL